MSACIYHTKTPGKRKRKEGTTLTVSFDSVWQSRQNIRYWYSTRFQHLLVESLLFHGGEVGFEFVFVDGFGDGHGSDSVADFRSEFVLFAELFPAVIFQLALWSCLVGERRSAKNGRSEERDKYMVTSTSSMVIFPWMAFIAAPAFFMAARVSWLMFADSIE